MLQIVNEAGVVVNQYDYDAFGRVRQASSSTFVTVENRYLFQGREWDKNGGFYYFRNRIYLPERGEFATPDMNLGRGILGELDGMATLTFCGGDPVNCIDPTGLIAYDLCSPYAVGQYAAAERRGETYDPFAQTKVFTELGREILSDPAEREGFLLGMKINSLAYCGSLTGPLALGGKLSWYSRILLGGASEGAQWFITDNGVDRLAGKTPDYGENSVEALQVAGTSVVLRGLIFGAVKAYQSLQKTVGGLMDVRFAPNNIEPVTGPVVKSTPPLPPAGAGGAAKNSYQQLYWHGSQEAVAARNEAGLFLNGKVGAGGKMWATTRTLEETWKGNILLGGNINVWPNPGFKGGFSATYKLTAEEAAKFSKAWGFEFSWNPIEWWKGAAGQYYFRPIPATIGQRLGEASIPVVGTGSGVGTLFYLNREKDDK